MRRRRAIALFVVLSAAVGSAWATTQSRVAGIITAVEPNSLTIAPMPAKSAVTGLIDAKRTHITVDGHAAKPNELHITYTAKAELGLDDVWVSVAAESR